ncbi:MAG: 5-amino-6-(D-ribitylamino)uracil--L-tyrosine 4-hydroxyphenyl transferase CofH [Betaproteobacteria bacterium]|nr:5-amino-6-(D-ribitylamino)uracil--L-tyrosine 4-hydroxyphenyl transferase CofH [Betaproteobacteria bacterium]MDH3437984.1 5-amino-6-(D-ribitylamino)uracil--L-tyrosine 4-hydroxyphenyl transferase CofH [Betaproteobacteria bacterium]
MKAISSSDIEGWLNGAAAEVMPPAARLRDIGHGRVVSYSRKVFIPLTRLCRDVCSYCTFARSPRPGESAYLSPDEVLAIARAGHEAGCHEALFTLGDRPERRWKAVRQALDALGFSSTVDYLSAMCERVQRETGLLPHVNAGVLSVEEMARLRAVSASQGLMLESLAERLCERGGPHFGSPDKRPAARLAMLRAAGELRIPFTTGILIGIGETRRERIDALLAIRGVHETFGHVQEVIIQNFRAKPGTRMAAAPDASREELLWTIAIARHVLGPDINIQAPPNLSGEHCATLIDAGINDWGGVSPVTPDHVNPEAPWPTITALRSTTEASGKLLVERLPSYPLYCREAPYWHAPEIARAVVRAADAEGFARADEWSPGLRVAPAPWARRAAGAIPAELERVAAKARAGDALAEGEIVRLFHARDCEFDYVCDQADRLRRETVGDTVRYVVNRNINYTNICVYRCTFCAFSKGRPAVSLRGAPYEVPLHEIPRRVAEAWARGATEVCMQGGIHPDYTGETYLGVVRAAREAAPGIHVHAFTPLEVVHGAATLGLTTREFLEELIAAGLGSLPGTAAEILDDEVRARICPDKVTTAAWLGVMEAAHELGLRSTATIMFGHVDAPQHWARHLARIRELQARTRGFTEFVPLPFVHMASPVYLAGEARKGPTFREAVLMHAVSRLALHGAIPNIQVSWVKMGSAGAAVCLEAGANDLGGTLMNESISRAAGTQHGQEMPPARMDELICSLGRVPAQRTTLYGVPPAACAIRSYDALPLEPVINPPPAPRRERPRARAA